MISCDPQSCVRRVYGRCADYAADTCAARNSSHLESWKIRTGTEQGPVALACRQALQAKIRTRHVPAPCRPPVGRFLPDPGISPASLDPFRVYTICLDIIKATYIYRRSTSRQRSAINRTSIRRPGHMDFKEL